MRLQGVRITANAFQLLGVDAALGRGDGHPFSPLLGEELRKAFPKVTYVDGALDIKESDQMVINSVTYRVQAVGEFTGAQSVLQVILSEVK